MVNVKQWFIEPLGSHTNKVLWGEAKPEPVQRTCADGKKHDLFPVSREVVEQAMRSKADLNLLFDVFCEVGFAAPKRVNFKGPVRGSKQYRGAARALKARLTRKKNRAVT